MTTIIIFLGIIATCILSLFIGFSIANVLLENECAKSILTIVIAVIIVVLVLSL